VTDRQLTPVDALAQLSFAIQDRLARRAAEHELSMTQTRLLGVLRDREPTMRELAGLLELDKSSVTGLIDRAQRRGLVTRAPSDHDGRAVLVRLTDDGRALVRDVAAAFDADVEALLAPLTAGDRAALTDVLSRMLDAEARARGIELFAESGPSSG
jgi:MarR family transcriptional regulator, lower aerobic nicotinate degradation pathway regulator